MTAWLVTLLLAYAVLMGSALAVAGEMAQHAITEEHETAHAIAGIFGWKLILLAMTLGLMLMGRKAYKRWFQ